MKNTKSRSLLILSFILLLGFLAVLFAVRTIDVQPIGPERSSVGLAGLNGAFHGITGFNPVIYKVSQITGYIVLATAAGFAVYVLSQIIRRRSIRKADPDLLVLAVFYLLILDLYVLFEVLIINYRPVILDEGLEASFPSTHTLLAISVMGIALQQFSSRISDIKKRKLVKGACILIMLVTIVCRLLSGVHWLTDIIAGALIGTSVLCFYLAVVNRVSRNS